MEDFEIIVNNIKYRVDYIMYRTKGSLNQKLLEDINDPNREQHVQYYIVSKDDKQYWIKEVNFKPEAYTGDTNCDMEVEKEYNRGRQINDVVIKIANDSISSVKYIAYEKNRVVQEYCDKYVKYSEIDLSIDYKERIRELIKVWIKQLPFNNYDMGPTNTLVKIEQGNILIKMIDLADSTDKTLEQCSKSINRMFK